MGWLRVGFTPPIDVWFGTHSNWLKPKPPLSPCLLLGSALGLELDIYLVDILLIILVCIVVDEFSLNEWQNLLN